MEFDINLVNEYEARINLKYEEWTDEDKINFFIWLDYKKYIKKLDTYMNNQRDEEYNYKTALKKYLDLGFKEIYSQGSEECPLRDDLDTIFINEKIIYNQNGIIGNIVKAKDFNGSIKLVPCNFYYEEKYYRLSNTPFFEIKEFYGPTPKDLKKIIDKGNLVTPWTHAFDEIHLTKKLHSMPKDTREIIATFDDDIINSLGYEKENGKIYSKKRLEF